MAMIATARRRVGYLVTILLLIAAAVACYLIWDHYLTAPWTRDGQVQAYVVNQAPEVSGRVVALHVADNQKVRKGDVLYEIDPVDSQVAVAAAEANVQSKLSDMRSKMAEAARRDQLTSLSTSEEEKQTFAFAADVARAVYASAITQLNQARIDLARTSVSSPVNGYITNLQLQAGDYATKGTRNISIVNTDSFWITGFFEETKLARIHKGDRAVAALMGFRDPVIGHVESIARGINTPNTSPGAEGLASVNPVFTWVRLAQRIPVRIHIDTVPATVTLAVGLTATVTVGGDAHPNSAHGLLSRVLNRSPD